MQRFGSIDTNLLLWQIGFGDKVNLRNRYWWNYVRVLFVEFTKVKDLRRIDNIDWDR